MAKRDRLTIQTVSGQQHQIVATRDGGSVTYDPPGRTSKLYRFVELSSVEAEITVLEVAESDVAWIKKDRMSLEEWREY